MELVAGYRRYHACLDAGVKKLLEEAREKKIHIIGVGIGPGTDFDKQVYDHHIVLEKLENLPIELAELIHERIEGESSEFY